MVVVDLMDASCNMVGPKKKNLKRWWIDSTVFARDTHE